MLLSMTGFGAARAQTDRWTAEVEVRSVNNRHLKISTKISEPYGCLEADIERLVRESIRRGAVQVSLRVDRPRKADDYRLNLLALTSYRDQLRPLMDDPRVPTDWSFLLALPGVVEDRFESFEDPRDDWPELEKVIVESLRALQEARAREGKAMAAELRELRDRVASRLDRIRQRGPAVLSTLRDRLFQRVNALLEAKGVSIEPADLIRETAVLAERSDIAEEITRLQAHLSQYAEVIEDRESSGRKLEFVVQEMVRETNTIGSKSNDVEISREVVEIKGSLEKIRELIQNVE